MLSSAVEIKLSSSRDCRERDHYEIGGGVYEFCLLPMISLHFEIADIIKIRQKRASKIPSRRVNDDRKGKKFIHLIEKQTAQKASPSENKCYQCCFSSAFFSPATFSKFVFNLLFRIEMQSTLTQRQFHLMTRRFMVFSCRGTLSGKLNLS